MLRVLIADDELRVCRLIEKLIEWEKLNLELIATASTGIEEYQLIEKYKPDIVITDIRMPGLDGLGVIEKVKQQGWQVDFIVVSGYKYFDYAYNALKFGVEDYLLKPIQKEELNAILGKIALARFEKEQFYQNHQKMVSEREASQEILQQSFMNMLMENKEKEAADIEVWNQEYHLALGSGRYLCYAMITDGDNFDKGKEEELNSFTHTLYKKMKKYFDKNDHICQNVIATNQVYIMGILNYTKNNFDILAEMEECFEYLLKFAQNFHGYSITLSLGEPENKWESLGRMVSVTYENLGKRLNLGRNRLIRYGESDGGRRIENLNVLSDEDVAELKAAIGSEEVMCLEYNLKEFFRKLNRYEKMDFRQYYEMVFKLIDICYDTLSEKGDLGDEKAFLHRKIKQIQQKDFIRNYTIRYLKESIASYIQKQKQKETKPIRQVKEYIRLHYAEAIGLEDAAELAELNPVYLSVLFKRSTGVNFNDYLTGVRVDEAKKLLRQTNDTINDIAEKVGYGNGKYFSQVFTKIAGITPTIYRRLHS